MPANPILYQGKAKNLYQTEQTGQLLLHFRDDTSAFNGKKTARLTHKGKINNQFNAFIMQLLQKHGVRNHFIRMLDPQSSLVQHLTMVPIECVIRNYAAGSIVTRLGITEAEKFDPPIFEFFLKNDPLGDPLINTSHILALKLADQEFITQAKQLTYQVNQILVPLFADKGMLLVDYKLEFGYHNNQLLLGDEFTPDGCRIWDQHTRKKMDKDRFRQNLGQITDSYCEVAERLGMQLNLTN